MSDKTPNTLLVGILTFVNRAALVLSLAVLGYLAWRVLGGDPAVPLGRKLEQELFVVIALAPLLFVALFTFIAKGLATGRFKGSGPGDFD